MRLDLYVLLFAFSFLGSLGVPLTQDLFLVLGSVPGPGNFFPHFFRYWGLISEKISLCFFMKKVIIAGWTVVNAF